MNEIKQISIMDFIKQNKLFLFILGMVSILCYGFTITNFSIGIDNTNYNFYYDQFGFLVQGRITPVFIDKFIVSINYIPFWSNFLGAFIMYVACALWGMLLKRVGGEKITQGMIIAFSTCMISYPMINELFIYRPLMTVSGYLFVAISLLALLDLYDNFNIKKFFISSVFMILSLSYFESFFTLFLTGIFIILILKFVTNIDSPSNFKQCIRFFLIGVAIFFFSIIAEKIIEIIVLAIVKPQVGNAVANVFTWTKYPILTTIKQLLIGFIYRYILEATWYLPVTIFVITSILSTIIAISISIKRKSGLIILLFLGLGLSVISLTLLKGHIAQYRMCCAYSAFTGFIALLSLILLKKKWMNVACGILIFILVINQSRCLNFWFVNDYNRYEQDKRIAIDVSQKLGADFDLNKPVVFIGNIAVAPNVSTVSNNGLPALNWAIDTFDNVYSFFTMHGYSFNKPSEDQHQLGRDIAANMPDYPKTGSIKEMDDYIVVNFGKNYRYKESLHPREQQIYENYVYFLMDLTGWTYDYANGQVATGIN